MTFWEPVYSHGKYCLGRNHLCARLESTVDIGFVGTDSLYESAKRHNVGMAMVVSSVGLVEQVVATIVAWVLQRREPNWGPGQHAGSWLRRASG